MDIKSEALQMRGCIKTQKHKKVFEKSNVPKIKIQEGHSHNKQENCPVAL